MNAMSARNPLAVVPPAPKLPKQKFSQRHPGLYLATWVTGAILVILALGAHVF